MQKTSWSLLVSMLVIARVEIAGATEEKIKAGDLPEAVAKSVEKRFPGLTYTSVTKETDAKGVIYDIELKQRGRKFETDVQADGTMLEVEKEVMKKSWPKSLRVTVEKKYPKGQVTEVLEVNKVVQNREVPDHLEVTITTAEDKSAEMLLSLDGKKTVEEPQAQPAQTAAAGDEEVKPADLPRSVSDAVKARFKDAKVKSAEKGTEDGKPIYEVSITSDERNIDVTLSPKGEILSFEKTLLPSDRPKAMMRSLNTKYPGSSIKLIEEVWERDKKTGYEGTIITSDKKTVEVTFDPHGRLIKKQK
jgi:uncharacterized membrane protein YkoI